MKLSTTFERIAVLALVVLAAMLRLANLDNVTSRTPDEAVYTNQAKIWLQKGNEGLRDMVANYKRDPATRQYPPPSRVGTIRLVAAAMELTGRKDGSAGATLSCAAAIASVALLALTGLRFFSPGVALLAVLFSAVSPMDLVIARRTWTDGLLELTGIVMVYVACEISRGSRRYFWYALLAATGGAAIAIKEYSVLTFGICLIWSLWALLRQPARTPAADRKWRNVLALVATATAGVGAAAWWVSHSIGGLSEWIQVISFIPSANAQNAYALAYATGPGYLLMEGLWTLSPIPALFSFAGLFVALRASRETVRNELAMRGTGVYWLVHLLPGMIVPHWLNLRYISAGFGAYFLLAGLGASRLFVFCGKYFGISGRRVLAIAVAGLLAGDACLDYQRFRAIFVRDATPDLSIKFLLDERDR